MMLATFFTPGHVTLADPGTDIDADVFSVALRSVSSLMLASPEEV